MQMQATANTTRDGGRLTTLGSGASPDEKTPRLQSVFGVDRRIRGPSARVVEFHTRGVARGDDHRSRSSIGRAE